MIVTGNAERYWEGRWRDEAAENERLRKRVEVLEAELRSIARAAEALLRRGQQ